MLLVDRLSVGFGTALAVREASFSLGKGERLAIVGESGSGKTLLGLSILGMAPEAARLAGSIRMNGAEIVGASPSSLRSHRGQRVAMIFQEPLAALNPLLRIGDILAEPFIVHRRLSQREALAEATGLLEEVGIPEPAARLRQFPHELSGGQRQRVLIALALSCDPDLLIADEPTTALDVEVAARIVALFAELSERRSMAVILISHDLRAVARVTSRIIVLYGGDIVEHGPTAEVIARPAHPYTSGLIEARPVVDPWRDKGVALKTIPGAIPPLDRLPAGCRFSGRCPVEVEGCAQKRPALANAGPERRAACVHLGEGASA